jgi:RecB family endonuclease NucS
MQLYTHLTANNITLKNLPFRFEIAMEAYLIENKDILRLDDEQFSDVEIIDTELPLSFGRKNKNTDGRVDILALYSQETIAVVELKLGELNKVHLEQLEDYLDHTSQILGYYRDLNNSQSQYSWIGVLVGSRIDENLAENIKNGLKTRQGFLLAALTIQRFQGEDNQIYVLTNTYFKQNSAKDYSKYEFRGKEYKKNRYVLAVLKTYVEEHPSITFAELKSVFPDKLIYPNKLGVFTTQKEAEEIVARTGRTRHFLKPEELIHLTDQTISVCNQWGTGNIENFAQHARTIISHT